jgi:hypothetical protein
MSAVRHMNIDPARLAARAAEFSTERFEAGFTRILQDRMAAAC